MKCMIVERGEPLVVELSTKNPKYTSAAQDSRLATTKLQNWRFTDRTALSISVPSYLKCRIKKIRMQVLIVRMIEFAASRTL